MATLVELPFYKPVLTGLSLVLASLTMLGTNGTLTTPMTSPVSHSQLVIPSQLQLPQRVSKVLPAEGS